MSRKAQRGRHIKKTGHIFNDWLFPKARFRAIKNPLKKGIYNFFGADGGSRTHMVSRTILSSISQKEPLGTEWND